MLKKEHKNKSIKHVQGNRGKACKKKTLRTKMHQDPLYGEIPILEYRYSDSSGKEYKGEYYDPNFTPKIPYSAVKGDITKQLYCPGYHIPKYYYVDEERSCVQCGHTFVFSGKEQKFWYETLQFNFNSRAIRCINCRKKKRSQKAMGKQLAITHDAYKNNTDDPLLMLELAKTICQAVEFEIGGDLEFAVALARKAFRNSANLIESLFWEGMALRLMGRQSKSELSFNKFLLLAEDCRRLCHLCTKAKQFIDPYPGV